MSEMVERVARAIDPSLWQALDEQCALRAYTPEERAEIIARPHYEFFKSLKCARAAIAAMRMPTESMLRRVSKRGGYAEEKSILDWQAMIDEALK
jgi:hypothetical protein